MDTRPVQRRSPIGQSKNDGHLPFAHPEHRRDPGRGPVQGPGGVLLHDPQVLPHLRGHPGRALRIRSRAWIVAPSRPPRWDHRTFLTWPDGREPRVDRPARVEEGRDGPWPWAELGRRGREAGPGPGPAQGRLGPLGTTGVPRGPVGLGSLGFAGEGRGSLVRLARGHDVREETPRASCRHGAPERGSSSGRSHASIQSHRSGRPRQDPTTHPSRTTLRTSPGTQSHASPPPMRCPVDECRRRSSTRRRPTSSHVTTGDDIRTGGLESGPVRPSCSPSCGRFRPIRRGSDSVPSTAPR